jgi:hypothetical protein
VDRHRFDADPDPIIHYDVYLDPDINPSFTLVGKSKFFFTFIHSNASLHCIIFLGIVIILRILDSILKFSGKKYSLSLHLVERETDSDPSGKMMPIVPRPNPQHCFKAKVLGVHNVLPKK